MRALRIEFVAVVRAKDRGVDLLPATEQIAGRMNVDSAWVRTISTLGGSTLVVCGGS